MTKVENKHTGDFYYSNVDTEKKGWLEKMMKENPEFFDRNDIKDLIFWP